MNCESMGELADLYLYGELAGQQEDDFEEHLAACEACRRELDRRTALHRGFDALKLEAPPALLAECRRELFESKPLQKSAAPWWAGLVAAWRQPLGAMALVALGFFSSRMTLHEPAPVSNFASLAGEPIASTIRSVEPDTSGRVRIALDETRRR